MTDLHRWLEEPGIDPAGLAEGLARSPAQHGPRCDRRNGRMVRRNRTVRLGCGLHLHDAGRSFAVHGSRSAMPPDEA